MRSSMMTSPCGRKGTRRTSNHCSGTSAKFAARRDVHHALARFAYIFSEFHSPKSDDKSDKTTADTAFSRVARSSGRFICQLPIDDLGKSGKCRPAAFPTCRWSPGAPEPSRHLDSIRPVTLSYLSENFALANYLCRKHYDVNLMRSPAWMMQHR